MGIAISEAKQMGLELPGLTLAEKMYQTLAEQGLSEEGRKRSLNIIVKKTSTNLS